MTTIYEHRQPGVLMRWILWGGSAAAGLWCLYFRMWRGYPWRFSSGPLLVAGILVIAAVLFDSLSVRVDPETIRLWFGPGWPRKTIHLADVAGCQAVRNTWRHGWGIHGYRRWWVFNVSGFDAVEVRLKNGGWVRIGTDDPAALESAIRQALPNSS
jgi:hypothetical protein